MAEIFPNEDLKLVNTKGELCDSLDMKNIKMEFEESDENHLLETKDIKQVKTEFVERETLNPFKSNEYSIGIHLKKEENDDILDRIETEDFQFVSPDTVDIDQIKATCETDALNIKPENETVDLANNNKSNKTRDKFRHKCPQCDYATEYKTNLLRHSKTKHGIEQDIKPSPVKPFQCEVCQKSFAKKGSLKNHTEIQHPQDVKVLQLQCQHCPYNTKNKKHFERHKRKHGDLENLTKHCCPICEYSTYYRTSLKVHIATHSAERPFVCEHCAFSTRTSLGLQKHIKNCHQHISDRRHKCTQCNFATNYKRYFTRHLLTHTPENAGRFSCSQCSYTTVEKRYLVTHIRRTHKTKIQCKS